MKLHFSLTSIFIICLAILGFTKTVYAQDTKKKPTKDTINTVFNSSVQEILNSPVLKIKDNEVSIAGRFSQTQEQAPAVVSVITREDIRNWGARDVADILRLIPGFEFAIDVQSLFGVGFRGIWGHEGKILLMIDSKIVNCFGYGNTNFFGTYPAAMIERIEIIRGPGSALYGGFAEAAVINIITPTGSQYHGIQANISSGVIGNNLSDGLVFNGNIAGGVKKNDLELSIQAGYNVTPTSTKLYTGFNGSTLQLGNELSQRQWQHLIAKLKYKNLSISYNRNETNYFAQAQFGSVLPLVNKKPLNLLQHYTETIQLNYIKKISNHFNTELLVDISRGNPITARVFPQISRDINGNTTLPDASVQWENILAKGYRSKTEIYFNYDKQAIGRLTLGGGYQLDAANSTQLDGLPGLQTSKNQADTAYWVTNPAYYAFFQYNKQINRFGITIGSRYETNRFGAAFAPRMGVTYVHNKLNIKVLYGRAFRVPLLWQAYSRQYSSSQNQLTPEITDTFEFEIGYKFTKKLAIKLNTYFIAIDKPITYIGSDNSYRNFGEIGSQGIESELNYKGDKFGAFLNAAFNTPTHVSSDIFLSANRQHFLGLASLKINAGAYIKLKKITISPTFSWLGERYGQDGTTTIQIQNIIYPAILISNVNFAYQITKKIDINLVINNIFDENYNLIQPYYGGHAPFPINNRQITLGLIYKISTF